MPGAGTTLALVALLAMTCVVSGAQITLSLPSGPQLIVDGFANDIMRVRVVRNPDDYAVTDVVVASDRNSELSGSCDGLTCKATMGNSVLDITVNTDGAIVATFSSKGKTLSTMTIGNPLGERTEATFQFPLAKRLYGIPEHAVDLSLKVGTTYRLMNLDVFHYKLDDPGGIYGSIPFMMAHGPAGATTGILFLNSADGNVAIADGSEGGQASTWSFEGGPTEVFFFPGPSPTEVQLQHASITGPTYLPPLFSLGYHQCRWNYRSSNDCLDVDSGFDTHNIPYDVLWLDIEHTDVKKYFTWDLHNFPEPQKLIDAIAAKGRKMVTITDPHIKREAGYHVHDEAAAKGFYVKNEQGNDYEGHCWPGTSSWVDFYNKDARDWYATLFKYDRYPHSTKDLYSWIDMNEPSVFNSPEVTMHKTAVHSSAAGKKVTHGLLHNMYGYYHTMAAFQGHQLRNADSPSRPFILTRSFFAGSQRYAAMWTGDNMAKWDHLDKSLPMLLTLSLSNYIFVGADVGGFFFEPEPALMVRWYQAAIFYPFFRGHAHLETKRREPWLFGEEHTDRIRNAIAMRYSLLPYLYTTFYKAHADGSNVIRPLFFEFPDEDNVDEQHTYMFGPSLLVRPITQDGVNNIDIKLPQGATWFDWYTGEKRVGGTFNLPVTMDTMPLYVRGGHIVPTKERLRRSSSAMFNDPLTLVVAANEQGAAAGQIYIDDSHSYDYEKGGYILKDLSFADNKLTCRNTARPAGHNEKPFTIPTTVERVVLMGLTAKPSAITVEYNDIPSLYKEKAALAVSEKRSVEFTVEEGKVILRKPDVIVDADWTITVSF